MASSGYSPSVSDLVSLEYPEEAKSSPGGRRVAFRVRTTNWRDNRYEHRLFVHCLDTGKQVQLTRTGNVTQMEWMTDESLLALWDRGGKAQVWLFQILAGEPLQVTDVETGVDAFKPTENGVLYSAEHPERSKRSGVRDVYGDVTHFESEDSASALWYVSLPYLREYNRRVVGLTEDEAKKVAKPVLEVSRLLGRPMKVLDFVATSDGCIVNCRSRDPLVYWDQVTSFKLKVNYESSAYLVAGGEDWHGRATMLQLPKVSSVVAVSPDESSLLVSHKERDNMSYTQADLWAVDLRGADLSKPLEPLMVKVSGGLDQRVNQAWWTREGVYVFYDKGTGTALAHLSVEGEAAELSLPLYPGPTVSMNGEGHLAFIGNGPESFPEVYASGEPAGCMKGVRRLTDYGAQVRGWSLGEVETIRWRSRDGAVVEGVLRKPRGYDPSRKYPLVFQVHGGPSTASRGFLLEPYDYQRYPPVQLVNDGVLVLKPNYRGSTGYGQAFLELNRDNLGLGDMWDLESAVDDLVAKGMVDPERVGCMGWSQGGYISAYVGLHSDKFRAVSVGAGISDWYTYRVSNDIPYFTDHYLGGTPWDRGEVYERTAPMSAIDRAHTPMLIQHGGKDQRVPLSDGMELYRALRDKGVPVEMFIYPEMAHPITKPRENRAVIQQNLDWFRHYLLDEACKPVADIWGKVEPDSNQ
ncbi:MAG: S9 family peptidase [Candidatus Bathyarchaeota archaeon]